MDKPQSIVERLGYSGTRYMRVLRTKPFALAPAVWTNGMSMAVALIVFLILALHPYDEFLSRMLFADGPLRRLRHITDIGLSKWYVIPAFIVAVCLIAIDWRALSPSRRMTFRLAYMQATYAFWAISLAGIFTSIAKFLIGRARPLSIDTLGMSSFSPFVGGDAFASFPSGHSTTMGAVGAILALWFPRWRMPIIFATIFIAFTRIVAQAHYPTDTIAGYSIGFLMAVTIARFLASRRTGFTLRANKFWPEVYFNAAFHLKKST